MHHDLRNILYLVAAVLFIFGIKGLTHPKTAVRGNIMGALGMLLAIVVTLIDRNMIEWWWIAIGLLAGTVAGAVLAARIQMTAMPQMVALLNGFGGAASFLVAGAELHASLHHGFDLTSQAAYATIAAGLIGAVTLSGSMIAFAKLQELIGGGAVTHIGLKFANVGLTVVVVALAVLFIMQPEQAWWYWVLVIIALGLGVTLVIPIGGADMPVVISLLNSYSGIAAAATGFVISNTVLIVAGALVGASGIILTKIMCVAMNRSLTNVLFGVMAPAGDAASADDVYGGKVKSTTPEEAAIIFDSARNVLIVPGYGLAVSQAQHAVRDLANLLQARGITVDYGIHPVAGRMPGHMNVLLAEADVPYEQLKEMDEVNSQMEQYDVALVIGANDTVNPIARTDPTSAIAGMPIINVDQARTVIVVKRSLSPGFAGIPNPLFALDNALMMFGDGKKAMLDLIAALKAG